MLVGSLTAQESQAAFFRGTSPEAGGRLGAGSAAHMTAVRGWRGRCLAPGNSPQAGGRLWLYPKTEKRLKLTSRCHVRGDGEGIGVSDAFAVRTVSFEPYGIDRIGGAEGEQVKQN